MLSITKNSVNNATAWGANCRYRLAQPKNAWQFDSEKVDCRLQPMNVLGKGAISIFDYQQPMTLDHD